MEESSSSSAFDFSISGVFHWIAEGFQGVIQAITSCLDYINPFSENFILKDIILNLGDVLSYLNPFSDNFILNGVLNFFGNLISFVNPFSDNFFGYQIVNMFKDMFTYLFVPDEENLHAFQNIFNEKLGFVDAVKDDFSQITDLLSGNVNTRLTNAAPSLVFGNINSKYYNGDIVVIDLSWYEPFKPFVDLILASFIYAFFILRVFAKLPGIISGVGSYVYIANKIDTYSDR